MVLHFEIYNATGLAHCKMCGHRIQKNEKCLRVSEAYVHTEGQICKRCLKKITEA